MHLRHRVARHAAVLWLIALASACGDSPVSPSMTSGVYELVSVSGRGPVSGRITLAEDGRAERRVRFTADAPEYVIAGTFTVEADAIHFELLEGGGFVEYFWKVSGTRSDSRFTLRYPDPADGPDIIKTYQREIEIYGR